MTVVNLKESIHNKGSFFYYVYNKDHDPLVYTVEENKRSIFYKVYMFFAEKNRQVNYFVEVINVTTI